MRKAEICAHIFSTNRLQHENSNHFLPAPPIGCHRAGPNRKPFPLIGRTGIWPHYPVSVDEVSSPLHAGWGKADLTYRFDRSRGTREILRKTPSGRQVERWQQHSLLYTLSKSSTSAVQWNTSMGLGYMHGIHRGRAITTSNLTLFGYSFSSSSYEAVAVQCHICPVRNPLHPAHNRLRRYRAFRDGQCQCPQNFRERITLAPMRPPSMNQNFSIS